MILAMLQATAILAGLGLVTLWIALMTAICHDAFAPQPGLTGRFSNRPAYPDGRPIISLAERIQARTEARANVAPWRTAA